MRRRFVLLCCLGAAAVTACAPMPPKPEDLDYVFFQAPPGDGPGDVLQARGRRLPKAELLLAEQASAARPVYGLEVWTVCYPSWPMQPRRYALSAFQPR